MPCSVVCVNYTARVFLQQGASKPSLSSLFKKPVGSWECDTCMVSNKAEASKCIACETPRHSAQPNASSKYSSHIVMCTCTPMI